MERNNALSIIIEEGDGLDLNVFAQLEEHGSDVNGDGDFDDNASWPSVSGLDPDLFTYSQQQPRVNGTMKLGQTQELTSRAMSLPAVEEMMYIAEKPKSAKEAAAYIKEKYEALNRLRLEAGLGTGPPSLAPLHNVVSTESTPQRTDLHLGHNGESLSHVTSRLHQLRVDSNSSNGSTAPAAAATEARPRDIVQPMAVVVNKTGDKMLSEQAVAQVELFYRSRKSDVHVCPCYAHLYQAHDMSLAYPSLAVQASNKLASVGSFPRDWLYVKTGVAVLLLEDEGGRGGGMEGGSLSAPRLSVLLAELGTGFSLWRETVFQSADYQAIQANFHALRLAHNPTSFAGFTFDDPASAADFLRHIREFAARVTLMTNNINNNHKLTGRRKKPKKADISSPCCFSHLTSLDQSTGAQLLLDVGCQPTLARGTTGSLQRQAMNLLQQYSTITNNANNNHAKTADIGSRFLSAKR